MTPARLNPLRSERARPTKGDVIVVWFSNGAASAMAAYETLRRWGDVCDVRLVNNPVAEEDEDNLRFARDVSEWLGRSIETCVNPKYPAASAVEVWDRRGAMSFRHGAPCTVHLKKEARQHYESVNHVDWHVLGYTADERDRHDNFILTERSNVLPVLIAAGLTKADCIALLTKTGIKPPRVYAEGYPNANCMGCVKATSATYWNLVRRSRPEVFAHRAIQSRRLGARLARCHPKYLPWCELREGDWWDARAEVCLHQVKDGKRKLISPRVFLDELPAEARGRPLKAMQIECGIFCEELEPIS